MSSSQQLEVDSYVMLLTPVGAAAIAVLRLTGPLVPAFVAQHISKPAIPGHCCHRRLLDGDYVIDDPVVVLHDGGAIFDLNLHGGPWVTRTAIDLALRCGFREISGLDSVHALEPAESLLEHEILQSIPAAQTELALSRLLNQHAAWREWEELAKCGQVDPIAARESLADHSLFHLLNPPRVAIIGIPNVGKSTLANALFAQERSIVADLPGTTRDWIGEIANIDGLAVQLLDTPGLRATADPLESAAIKQASAQIHHAELLILVLDPTQPSADQMTLVRQHPHALVASNKVDAIPVWDTRPLAQLSISAGSGQGIPELRRAVLDRFGIHRQDEMAMRWWLKAQRLRLERAIAPIVPHERA